MTRLSWALLGVLPLATAVACGGGEDRPHGDGSGGAETGGAGGKGGKGSGGGSNTGGGGSGGSESGGTGGIPPDGGPPPDTTPPTFDGATGVEIVAEDRVRVSWDAASDDVSPEKRLAYYVYRATESGAEDFTRARRCRTPDPEGNPQEESRLPCFVTAGAGTSSVVVRDVIPAHPYFFVVRAVDEAGNEDGNATEVTAKTDDTTGPEFGGVRTVKVVTATSLRIGWGAGYDLASADAQLKFRVYASAGKNPDPAKDDARLTSKAGEHEAVIDGLDPLTAYKVMVRAVDPTGNEDGNARVLGATTPEGQPPSFDGASRALEEGLDSNGKARIRVFWPPGTDNITDIANIVYDVYQSTRSHLQKFEKPTYTSEPGASSMLVTGLEPGTRYYFVVRARDVAGNEDGNIKEVLALTRPLDMTPPTFAGATTVTSLTPSSLRVTWSPANDAITLTAAGFQYLVYVSTGTPVDSSGVPFMVVPGLTSATIGGLSPDTDYHVVVRAKDLAGNVSTTLVDKAGKTLPADPTDTVAPTFTATPTVTIAPATPTSATVAWTAATDASGANNVRYLVCASMIRTDCEGSDFFHHVFATTDFGVLSAIPQFLTTRTDYFFYVRAEDRAGNVETGLHSLLKATATSFRDDVAPILSSRCGACHDFSSVARLVGVASQINWACPTGDPNKGCALDLVEPTAPEFSAIYRKVNPPNQKTAPFSDAVPNEYSGLQEPRDTSDKLSPPEDDALRVWIVQGAFGN
jgi:hypothetical protein